MRNCRIPIYCAFYFFQGDSLLLSSGQSSMLGELTEDRTLSEGDMRADYLEEIKK